MRSGALPALFAVLASAQPALAQSAADDGRAEAQAAYVAGDNAAARAILERLLAARPDDADLLRRYANVQAADGDLADARTTIDRALALAPADPDVQLARANILVWQGRKGEARAQADAVAAMRPDYPGLSETRAAIARQSANDGFRLFAAGLGATVSHVEFPSGASASWKTVGGAIAASLDPRTRATFEIEHEIRAVTDTRLALRGDFLRGETGSFFISGSVVPDADFRESWSLAAGGERAAGPRTMILFDTRYAAYRGADVFVAGLGVRQALRRDLSLTLRTINLFGGGEDYRLGGAVRLDHAPEAALGAYVSAASYPDTEAGTTRQLHALGAGISVPLDDVVRLRLGGEYEKREGSYERSALALGLGWTFGR